MHARAAASAATLAMGLLIGLAACSSNSDGDGGSKATDSGSASASDTGTATGGLTASPSPTGSPISGECGSVLPVSAVDQIMGQQVPGTTSFIVGIPDPDIDRISYLNCRYGIPAPVAGQPEPTAQIEVGISAYGSAASAQSRVQGTIDAYRQQGATASQVPVGQQTGTILVGSGDPTLVVSSGNKTVAVTVAAALATDATRNAMLSGLAQRALTGLGG